MWVGVHIPKEKEKKEEGLVSTKEWVKKGTTERIL